MLILLAKIIDRIKSVYDLNYLGMHHTLSSYSLESCISKLLFQKRPDVFMVAIRHN